MHQNVDNYPKLSSGNVNHLFYGNKFEPPRDKANKMACAPSEDSAQPGHPRQNVDNYPKLSSGNVNHLFYGNKFEPPRDKANKMACAPSEDSDQPGNPPSLIRVFAVFMKKARVLSYPLSA